MNKFKELQKEVYDNKLKKFGKPLIEKEFCYLHKEVSEAFESYLKKDGDLGEELADIAIFTMGIAEHFGINLGKEIEKKIRINNKRTYHMIGNFYEKDN